MLNQYLQRTQLLLTDPSFEIFNPDDLTNYVNMARGQIAGQEKCIRVGGTLAIDSSSQQYSFSSINLGGFTNTVTGVLNVRQISYVIGTGQSLLHSRGYPWFNTFVLSDPAPVAGAPQVWSQYGQGASGTIYFNLLDGPYTANLDVVGYPVDLTSDSTGEALPYQWTDAVPFFAAYFASLTIGNGEKAKAMFDEFTKFTTRARGAATSEVLPGNFAQAPDPYISNRLGLPNQRGQQ